MTNPTLPVDVEKRAIARRLNDILWEFRSETQDPDAPQPTLSLEEVVATVRQEYGYVTGTLPEHLLEDRKEANILLRRAYVLTDQVGPSPLTEHPVPPASSPCMWGFACAEMDVDPREYFPEAQLPKQAYFIILGAWEAHRPKAAPGQP